MLFRSQLLETGDREKPAEETDKEVDEEVGRNSVEHWVVKGKLKVFQWGECDQLHHLKYQ